MRLLIFIIMIVSIVSMLFKWRYRIINMLLSVRIFRKVSVRIAMNVPTVRERMLPNLFSSSH